MISYFKFSTVLFLLVLAGCFLGASCKTIPEDKSSNFALASGQATQILGGCSHAMTIGHEYCPFYRGMSLPTVRLTFTNPAEYSVSDCDSSIYVTGNVTTASVVEVDLSSLTDKATSRGFCFVKIDALEYYSNPLDKNQKNIIGHAGWIIFEALEPGYEIVPSPDVLAFCYKVSRTTKGRTIVEKVSCQ